MATVADLMRVEGRAELVDGVIIRLPLTIGEGRVAWRVAVALVDHETLTPGEAFTSSLAYVFPAQLSSGRQSISPAASWYSGPVPENEMGPVIGPPTFAMEFASELTPERIRDYFEAGTRVVWSVDLAARTVEKWDGPDGPAVTFQPGEVADAEPAVSGWRIAVNDVFREKR